MCKFIQGYENGNNDNFVWIHWLQLTLMSDYRHQDNRGRCQGTVIEGDKSDRKSKKYI